MGKKIDLAHAASCKVSMSNMIGSDNGQDICYIMYAKVENGSLVYQNSYLNSDCFKNEQIVTRA